MWAKHILTYDHMVQQPITYALKNLCLVYTLDQFLLRWCSTLTEYDCETSDRDTISRTITDQYKAPDSTLRCKN
jgi:hypothetical protein